MTIGDIGAVIDSLEFDTGYANMPSICHVSGNVYAIAYWGPGNDGFLCTFSIDSVGNIGAAIIDSWEWQTTYGAYPKILKVYGTIYAIVYTDVSVLGQLITFSIANNGTITKSTIDTGQFSPGPANPHHFSKIASNVFSVVYTDGLSDGWIQSIRIANDGTITTLSIDSLEFDGVTGMEGSLCNVSGSVYAIAYRGPGDDGWLCTLTISDAGLIGAAVIDTLEFDTVTCVEPSIVKARDNFFAIAYSGSGADGWLKIVEIDNSGNITDPPVDSYEFDTLIGQYPWLYAIGLGYLALSYTKSGGFLWVYTFQVDAAGSLNATTLDTQLISSGVCTYSELINRSGNYFAVAYAGPDTDGFIKSFPIESPALGFPQHLMMTGIG